MKINTSTVIVIGIIVVLAAALVAPALADWVTTTISTPAGVYAIGVNPFTNKVYAAGVNGRVKVINGATHDTSSVAVGSMRPADAAAPGENRRGNVVVLNAASGRVLTTIETQAVPFSLAFTPDGTRLVCGLRVAPAQTDAGIASTVVYDARTGGHVASLAVRQQNGVTVAVSPDGTRLITAAREDQTLRIWDAHRYELLLTIRVQPDRLRSLAVSPDGNRIAAGTWNGAVYVWDAGGRARDPVPGIQTGDRR